MKHYDVLIVGAGLFGSILAYNASQQGKSVLVLEKRNHIGGNCYTSTVDDINVHVYGAHIFRTSKREIWDFMSQFCEFNHYINSPIANFHGQLYNMPFNMNTFTKMWSDVTTPDDVKKRINEQKIPCDNPQNLEEHILSLVGREIYEKLVKGYTEKQWGAPCNELPASIMRRIPLRFTFDNNYFVDPYQGIPKGGYTPIFEKLLSDVDVKIGTDFLENKDEWEAQADLVIYTGPIDAYYDFCFGELGYRSLRFETERITTTDNYQGVAVMNFTDAETPYTRIIEHKHFEFGTQPTTIISREYPQEWRIGIDPYYPMEDNQNRQKYEQYYQKSLENPKVKFGGRLGEYRYYDMQDTVRSALEKSELWLK